MELNMNSQIMIIKSLINAVGHVSVLCMSHWPEQTHTGSCLHRFCVQANPSEQQRDSCKIK